MNSLTRARFEPKIIKRMHASWRLGNASGTMIHLLQHATCDYCLFCCGGCLDYRPSPENKSSVRPWLDTTTKNLQQEARSMADSPPACYIRMGPTTRHCYYSARSPAHTRGNIRATREKKHMDGLQPADMARAPISPVTIRVSTVSSRLKRRR